MLLQQVCQPRFVATEGQKNSYADSGVISSLECQRGLLCARDSLMVNYKTVKTKIMKRTLICNALLPA
jgi:hypothetical protein